MKSQQLFNHTFIGLTAITLTYPISVQAQKQKEQPNILWITCEDISPYIHCFGEKVIKTPNIDQLAKDGVKYNSVYTTAGVCAPSRSSIITGTYQMSVGTHQMRTQSFDPKYMGEGVPNYSAVIPEDVKCFPEYLRMAGYYTTNNQKEDYQFVPPVTVWDESSFGATFENRPNGKPFFAVFNLFVTHESQLWGQKGSLQVNPDSVIVPPYYPDTKTVRHDIARLFTNIEIMDAQVGEIVKELKEEGLYDQTTIFFYSDHGGSLPWMKREVLERGIHIPMVIKFPGQKYAGTENNDLISSVDFAPTVLSISGVKIPAYMQGKAFLGEQKTETPRKYIYAGRDRMDEKYDRVRAVRDKGFEYIYNYMPEKPSYQDLAFRLDIPMMKEMLQLRDEGKLNEFAMAWFKSPKAVEELYDLEKDPYELHNLASDPVFKNKLEELRNAFWEWTMKFGDMASIPEKDMVRAWWKGSDKPPVTAKPEVTLIADKAVISCETSGASIGYRILKHGQADEKLKRIVKSWDSGTIVGMIKNGGTIEVSSPWQVYDGNPIKLQNGEKLLVKAMRIGYQPASTEFVFNK